MKKVANGGCARLGVELSSAAAVLVTALCAGTLHAQTLTSRLSTLNYQATYGGGGDASSPSDTVTDGELLSSDSSELNFVDSRAGFINNNPERPWGASVSVALSHAYSVTGPLDAFTRIQASGSADLSAASSGEGLASMISSNPGNSLELRFTLTAPTTGTLSGQVELTPDGQNLAAFVTLQRFDGIVWANIFNSLFLSGQEGIFDQPLSLTAGEYRVIGTTGGNVFHNVRPSQTNTWSYDLRLVPTPGAALALALGCATTSTRRRREVAKIARN